MEPLDLDGLEAVVRAAQDSHGLGDWHRHDVALRCGDFVAAANPSTVLRLVEMARLGDERRVMYQTLAAVRQVRERIRDLPRYGRHDGLERARVMREFERIEIELSSGER